MNEEEILTEELVEVDVDAKDMRFDDEVFLQTEMDLEDEEDIITDSILSPTTHDVDEAIPGTLENE